MMIMNDDDEDDVDAFALEMTTALHSVINGLQLHKALCSGNSSLSVDVAVPSRGSRPVLAGQEATAQLEIFLLNMLFIY